jgi:hypothetical protein
VVYEPVEVVFRGCRGARAVPDSYGAYVCQSSRSFRDVMDHLGFYARGQISPHFPLIRKTWETVEFSDEEGERRRASGDPDDAELASIIERVLASPIRGGHRAGSHKVLLLSPPGHPDTLTLPQPITHLSAAAARPSCASSATPHWPP